MTRVRLPRMLNADFSERERLHPTACSLTMLLREASYAQMTTPAGEGSVFMHAWMEIYTQNGSAGLFRVTGIEDSTENAVTVTAMHGIDTLSDSVWRAQLDYDGTVQDYLQALLAQQEVVYWQLGVCEDTADWKRAGINYTRLSELFRELGEARTGFYFEYDFSTTPWTVNMRALPAEVSAEFRMSRNVETARFTRSDKSMCNRLHLSINTQVTQDGVTTNSVEIRTYNDTASQLIYGVIERVADIDTNNVADPDAWGTRFVAQRAQPAVQITIEGYELSALTGDSWDEFSRGRMVRVAFGAMGETINERVESVTYPDLLGEPERVTVELANRLDKFSETIANLQAETARAGGAARSAARGAASAEELKSIELIVRDHTDALDATGISELWESGIILDPQTGVRIYSLEQGFQSNYSSIKVNNDAITALVRQTGVNDLGQGETLYSLIDANAQEISTKVAAGDIASSINQTAQAVRIQASKIDLDGYVTASDLSATNANITNLTSGATTATLLKATGLQADSTFNFSGHQAAWRQFTFLNDSSTPVTAWFMVRQN